ncbi:hypothetical protein [Geomonas oryzae]|uniref:hypothetical protein n=1 Tax=Geomonas oryzae TaxID=2364273 RepID=UPI00100A59D5|nr:hypothetical protein [Geomonas oryzae]
MKLSRTWVAVLLNIIFGNTILLVTVTSNWFLSSLLLNVRLIFLTLFTIGSLASIPALGYMMGRINKQMSKIIWALFFTALPVQLTCWIVIGYAFRGADDFLQKIQFVFKFGSLIALTAGAIYWLPLGIINFFILRRVADNTPKQTLRPYVEMFPIFIIAIVACFAVGSLTKNKGVSTPEPAPQLQKSALDKAKAAFCKNVVDCHGEIEPGINDTLYEEDRFAALFPRLNLFGKSHKFSGDLAVYFTSKDDLFRNYIEITYGGKTSVIDTHIHAVESSGVVIDNILYLAWLLGPEKGHLQPEQNGKIYLMAFDLAERKEIYRRVIYSGSNELRYSSLGYFTKTKELVLAFELLNSTQFVCIGKIPVSSIKSGLDVDFNPSKIELSGFNVQHELPRFFISANQLYYFSGIENKAFILLKIDEELKAKEKYLLNIDRDSRLGHNPIVISCEKDGHLKIYEHKFNEPPSRCRKIAIDKIFKL